MYVSDHITHIHALHRTLRSGASTPAGPTAASARHITHIRDLTGSRDVLARHITYIHMYAQHNAHTYVTRTTPCGPQARLRLCPPRRRRRRKASRRRAVWGGRPHI